MGRSRRDWRCSARRVSIGGYRCILWSLKVRLGSFAPIAPVDMGYAVILRARAREYPISRAFSKACNYKASSRLACSLLLRFLLSTPYSLISLPARPLLRSISSRSRRLYPSLSCLTPPARLTRASLARDSHSRLTP